LLYVVIFLLPRNILRYEFFYNNYYPSNELGPFLFLKKTFVLVHEMEKQRRINNMKLEINEI